NAHVVIEEAPAVPPPAPSREMQLLVLSAKTASALEAATANLAAFLAEEPNANLADVAYTLQVGRRVFEHRRALVCHDRDEALQLLATPDRAPVRTAQQAQSAGQSRSCSVAWATTTPAWPGNSTAARPASAPRSTAAARCFSRTLVWSWAPSS